MYRLLHLIGPGGAGKTTIGAMLADKLGWQFIDLDERFMAAQGDISSFIQHHATNVTPDATSSFIRRLSLRYCKAPYWRSRLAS